MPDLDLDAQRLAEIFHRYPIDATGWKLLAKQRLPVPDDDPLAGGFNLDDIHGPPGGNPQSAPLADRIVMDARVLAEHTAILGNNLSG